MKNGKFVVDVFLCLFAVFLLVSTIFAVSTTSWFFEDLPNGNNRTGIFQRCVKQFCCEHSELDRSISFFVLLDLIFLSSSSIFSVGFATIFDEKRFYLVVPLSSFFASINMSLTIVRVLSKISINAWAGQLFVFNTFLAYFFSALTLVHGFRFYF